MLGETGQWVLASRGAAAECSPGREPGVFFRHDLSPGGAKESSQSCAPYRGCVQKQHLPVAALYERRFFLESTKYRRSQTAATVVGTGFAATSFKGGEYVVGLIRGVYNEGTYK